jgi:DNA polymerase elongation subunit (family B)
MDNETNPFKKSIYDGLQQAYKVTANSLYGQTGAPTSPICKKEIAASTTATGRDMLQFAKHFIEVIWTEMLQLAIAGKKKKLIKCIEERFKDVNPKKLVSEKEGYSNIKEFSEWFYNKTRSILDGYSIDPKVIYGDTDSVFFCMNILDKKTNVYLKDKTSLEISIKLGMFASYIVNLLLPSPMVLAYEKVLWPFIILAKKKYVGNLYETNPNKFYQKCMGIVMKRRDNSPIVKIVVGGIIDKILNERDPEGAIKFVRDALNKIITGKYNIDKFITTKTLKSFESYKDWSTQAHAVLAHRMGVRNPGNAPQPNDRVPYCYIEVKGKVKLQGDRVEHPDYILEKKLKLDYLFYITNQIMKPSLQFLELIAHNPTDIFKDYIIKEKNTQKGVMPICAIIDNYNAEDESDIDGYDINDNNDSSDSESSDSGSSDSGSSDSESSDSGSSDSGSSDSSDKKNNKTNKITRNKKSTKSVQNVKNTKSIKSVKSVKSAKSTKSDKSDKSDKNTKSTKSDKSDKNTKSTKSTKSVKSAKSSKNKKSDTINNDDLFYF